MTEATLRLMTMPQNPELERVINLTKNAIEQLERQNPLSSLHGTQSKATATAIPQASRTPGGHQRQQQNRRNQEDQEAASSNRPEVANHKQIKFLALSQTATTTTVGTTGKR